MRNLGKKFRNHKKELHHNFIYFKKKFDRIWRNALLLVMKKHIMGLGLAKIVEALYNNDNNEVLANTGTLEWFEQQLASTKYAFYLRPSLISFSNR